YQCLRCRLIDIPTFEDSEIVQRRLVEQIVSEIQSEPSDTIVAYRDKHRWVQTFDQVKLKQEEFQQVKLRDHGVYLITGGLGGIGTVLAEWLIKQIGARLILIGRTEIPPKECWNQWQTDDPELARKVQALKRLDEMGGHVEVFSADVA